VRDNWAVFLARAVDTLALWLDGERIVLVGADRLPQHRFGRVGGQARRGSIRMGNLRHEPYPSGWHERMAGADDLFKLRL
jgi:hypothetical protein